MQYKLNVLLMDTVKLIALLASLAAVISKETCSEEEVFNGNLKKLALANNYFAINLHQKIAASSTGNVFFSPFTMSSTLTMLYSGAKGGTAMELRRLLGFHRTKLADDVILDTYQRFLEQFLSKMDQKICTVSCASTLITDGSFSLNADYKKQVSEVFQAYIYDEGKISDSKLVVEKLNSWVKVKTNGTIKNLVDYVDPSMAFVLASAAYFKGTWKVKFEPGDTKYHFFYNRGSVFDRSEILMMHAAAYYHYYEEGNEFTAIELTYEGENFTMMIFLPERLDGLRQLVRRITPESISFVRKYMFYTKVHLTLPKFKQGFNRDLSIELKELGLNKVFSLGADFSGMTEKNTDLVVDEVKHKALIEVNEEGSVAASISRVMMAKMVSIDYVPEFKVDHPFLFAILESRSGMILFMGTINQL